MADTLKDIPKNQVSKKVKQYIDADCTSIKCKQQPDGKWTVVAS